MPRMPTLRVPELSKEGVVTSTLTIPYEIVHEDTSTISRPEWLALRKSGLGSSDVAAAMSLTPWSSPYALYCDKRNLVPDTEQSEFFEWKLDLETPILNWVEKKRWVYGPVRRHLMLRSVKHPFLLANPDGLADDCVVEVKTASAFDEKRWEDGIPDQYAIQAHVLMAVTGRNVCMFPVMFDTKEPRPFVVEWDPAVGEPMLEAAAKFWQQVQGGIEPDPDASEATMLALRARFYEVEEGESIELESDDLIRLRNAAVEIVKANQEIVDGVKTNLMSKLGPKEIVKVGDNIVATWKQNKAGKRTFLFKDLKESA